ncbi:MAG: DMT family transporter [Silicimonas sp.]|nr:DMT family transporter [Silicimonas sp.]
MQRSANLQGALLMMGSMTAFTVNDTFLKLLSVDLPFFQILFLRSVGVVALMGVLAHRAGVLRFRLSGPDKKLIALRSVAEVGAAWFFISALFHLPIANVTAIIQALPLTVTLGAALVLREPVGWRRLAAIAVGFVGVWLIVRPGTDSFDIYSLYAVAAVACVTVRDLCARRVSSDVASLTIAFITGLAVLAFSAAGAAVIEWKPVSNGNWAFLACSIIAILGGYLFSVSAMRVGEVGFVAQFRYTSLLVALVLGLTVFGDWPSDLTLLGAAIVVASGLFTLWREREVRKEDA